jgi:hypothetical protein
MLRLPRHVAALASAAAIAAGCGDPLAEFSIRLALDTGSEDATCELLGADAGAPTCHSYSLYCPALVSIRILSQDDPSRVFAERCLAHAGSATTDLCSLAAIDEAFADVPRERAVIELAVWDQSALADSDECPTATFDLAGRPRPQTPMPAFGRAVYFDLGGTEPIARIELACADPDRMSDEFCLPVTARASVLDAVSLLTVSLDQAPDLAVSLGEPEDTGGVWRIRPGAIPLPLAPTTEGLAPVWEKTLPTRYPEGHDLCVQVLDPTEAQTTTAIHCSQSGAAGELDLEGYLVPKATLDAVLAAMGEPFPPGGLIVGRVVDRFKLPVPGVKITPSEGAVLFSYLNDDLTAVGGATTSASGMFVAKNAPFTTAWTATQPMGTLVGEKVYRGGVVQNRVTVLVIVMVEPG